VFQWCSIGLVTGRPQVSSSRRARKESTKEGVTKPAALGQLKKKNYMEGRMVETYERLENVTNTR